MKITSAMFLLLFLSFPLEGAESSLEELEESLQAAETTTEMIAASHAIFVHLDQVMTKIETDIKKGLSDDVRKTFESSAVLFRKYREAEAEVVYLLYDGGSMRGLAGNAVREKLTRERIDYLRNFSPELP